MVTLLTLLHVLNYEYNLSGGLSYALSTMIVVGAIYWALRGH